jgi:phosphatidylinositol-3-phosphatase
MNAQMRPAGTVLVIFALSACGGGSPADEARTDAGSAGDTGNGTTGMDSGNGTTGMDSGSADADRRSSNGEAGSPPGVDGGGVKEDAAAGSIQHVFVIAMENHDSTEIYGDMTDAPYINTTLLSMGAHATDFGDELAHSVPSEPHYVWMEAATNTFADCTFTSDADPSASNSTSNTAHLVRQIEAAGGATWRTYQEGLDATTGACPIHSNAFYAAKHDPFVFFQDVSGNPPSTTSVECTTHHRAYGDFATDLASGDVASYTFITPNLCNDMHGAVGCPNANEIQSGDSWLMMELPPIINYANAHRGVVFVTWDEGDTTGKMPFVALGPTVKAGHMGGVAYDHGSVVKSIEEIFGLPILPTAASASDLSDLFTTFP